MEGLSKVASKMPLLEDLEISYSPESRYPPFRLKSYSPAHKYLEVIGRSCPLLKSLRLNKHEGYFEYEDNRDAFAIARTMHSLQNLQLFGNKLNDSGFRAIVEGCPRLESLDLRKCTRFFQINSKRWDARLEDLRTRCTQQMKKLGFPDDCIDDYEHLAIHGVADREYENYLDS